MTKTMQGLYKFFSGFGIPAYSERSVPDDAELPYITYAPAESDWDTPQSVSATVWYPGTSYTEISATVDKIKDTLSNGCYRVPVDGGCLQIYMDNPFCQEQDSGIANVKAMYLLFGVHCLVR